MIVVTGATGQLGRLVIASLLKSGVPANTVVAAVRNPAKAEDLAASGVVVRRADYAEPASLDAAFVGAQRILLISGNEIGQRTTQHRAVIDAAKRVGVALLAYTSLLHADRSPLFLAGEHRETEEAIAASGVPAVILRNGWYNENFASRIAGAVATGVMHGSAGEGRFSAAARADYAEAAAAVLSGTLPTQTRVLELAGSDAYSLAQLAAKVAAVSGKPIRYENVSQSDYQAALVQHGLPEAFAGVIADSDSGAASGALFDDSDTLATLIGRPTISLEASIAAVLAS